MLLYIIRNDFEGGLDPPVRFLGPANSIFWLFLTIFGLPRTPPDHPNVLDHLL